MDKQIEISKDFWKEYEARGFSVHKETGGTFCDSIKDFDVKNISKNVYKLIGEDKNTSITVIDPAMFFKTVKKIEDIVNYKLFF